MKANKIQLGRKGKNLNKRIIELINDNHNKLTLWHKGAAYIADKEELRQFAEFNNKLKRTFY